MSGCLTPGSNIQTTVFERINLGYQDEKNSSNQFQEDGIPDNLNLITKGNLKGNATNGDIIQSEINVFLSNGNRTGGFDIALLNEKGIYLRNLYVKMELTRANIVELDPDVANVSTISIAGAEEVNIGHPIAYGSDSKTFIYKITAADARIDNFNDLIGQVIKIKTRFRIKKLIAETDFRAELVYIDYDAAFSDCDNCIADDQLKFDIYAGEVSCDWLNVLDPCPDLTLKSIKYMCTNATAVFKFTPSMTTAQVIASDNHDGRYCKKLLIC